MPPAWPSGRPRPSRPRSLGLRPVSRRSSSAFKNQLDKFLKVGIAPIAASGQFGATIGAIGGGTGNNGGTGRHRRDRRNRAWHQQRRGRRLMPGDRGAEQRPEHLGRRHQRHVAAGDPQRGDLGHRRLSLRLHQYSASTPADRPDQASSSAARAATQAVPVLVFGNSVHHAPARLGRLAAATGSARPWHGGGDRRDRRHGGDGRDRRRRCGIPAARLTTASTGGRASSPPGRRARSRHRRCTRQPATVHGATGGIVTFSDRLLGSVNRNTTTDFAAPALDVADLPADVHPATASTTTSSSEGGTSVSSAIVTGSYSLVSSALDYWGQIRTRSARPPRPT